MFCRRLMQRLIVLAAVVANWQQRRKRQARFITCDNVKSVSLETKSEFDGVAFRRNPTEGLLRLFSPSVLLN
jgi:hypothetical protein